MDFSLKTRRKLWLKVHLYLGMFAGAVFVLIGLTGSLLAFGSTLDAWLNPELMTVPMANENTVKPLDEILAAGLKALPPGGKVLDLDFPFGIFAKSAHNFHCHNQCLIYFCLHIFFRLPLLKWNHKHGQTNYMTTNSRYLKTPCVHSSFHRS